MKIIFFGLVMVIIVFSFSYESDARLIPLILGFATLVLILLDIINGIRPLTFIKKLDRDLTKDYMVQADSLPIDTGESFKKIFGLTVWILGFFLIILMLGFHIGIVVFAFTFFKFKGKTGWMKALIATGVIWAFVFVVFEIAMGFELYKGLI